VPLIQFCSSGVESRIGLELGGWKMHFTLKTTRGRKKEIELPMATNEFTIYERRF
jgi:hypothetical protein